MTNIQSSGADAKIQVTIVCGKHDLREKSTKTDIVY